MMTSVTMRTSLKGYSVETLDQIEEVEDVEVQEVTSAMLLVV